jgi:hypothetical protein
MAATPATAGAGAGTGQEAPAGKVNLLYLLCLWSTVVLNVECIRL